MKNNKLKITIRPIKLTDVEALTSLVNSLFEEKTYTVIQKKFTKKEEEKYVKGLLKNDKNISYVLDFNGKVMGICGIAGNDSVITNHIGDIGILIRKEARGMGWGEKLFKKVISEGVKKYKFKIVRLDVFSANKPAIGLYKKVGFKIVGIIKNGGMHFGKPKDIAIMVKYIK